MKRTTALRWSLLTSLGLVPLACSGSGADDEASNTAGTGGAAGDGQRAGAGGQNETAIGGAGGQAETAIGGGAGGGPRPHHMGPPACTNAKLDAASGLTACDEGYSYRSQGVTCTSRRGAESAGGAGGADGGAGADDHCDEDCARVPHGFCGDTGVANFGVCRVGCLTDNECEAAELCDCGSDGGVCVTAACHGDADCKPDYHCTRTYGACDSPFFVCQKPTDECLTNQDCDTDKSCLLASEFGIDSAPAGDHFICGEGAQCGRPFLIEAEARVAPAVTRGDWSGHGSAPAVAHLTTAERAAWAAHWTHAGQMEHASIAAFARFSLQLLSLGAPPELVEACTQALVDETAHARLSFSLASAYAGRAVGPGPLDVTHSLDATSLLDIVDLVIAEGCFGETSAALEALEAADAATDPVIAAAYSQIASDEQRHAELAFRFVRWTLERNPAEVAPRVARAIAAPPRNAAALMVAAPCLKDLLMRSCPSVCQPVPLRARSVG